MNEVLEFLKKYHTFYLATVEGDQPRVRPFGVAEEYNGKLYTQTGKKKNVILETEGELIRENGITQAEQQMMLYIL